MTIREEFSRLIFMYQEAAEGKEAPIQEIFQKSLTFIEMLKKQLAEGDEEDRKAAARMMSELYQHMKDLTKLMSQKAGVSEEELIATSENRSNFTPEQWKSLEESRQRLAKAGEELTKLIQAQPPQEGQPAPEKKERKPKKPKKSHWMRS